MYHRCMKQVTMVRYGLNPEHPSAKLEGGVSIAGGVYRVGDVIIPPQGKSLVAFSKPGPDGSPSLLVQLSPECKRCGQGPFRGIPCSVECYVKAGYSAENYEVFIAMRRQEMTIREANEKGADKAVLFDPREEVGPPVNVPAPKSIAASDREIAKVLEEVLVPVYPKKVSEEEQTDGFFATEQDLVVTKLFDGQGSSKTPSESSQPTTTSPTANEFLQHSSEPTESKIDPTNTSAKLGSQSIAADPVAKAQVPKNQAPKRK